jgi:hypothetical protein
MKDKDDILLLLLITTLICILITGVIYDSSAKKKIYEKFDAIKSTLNHDYMKTSSVCGTQGASYYCDFSGTDRTLRIILNTDNDVYSITEKTTAVGKRS